jgi:hypothetical protein
MLMTFLNPFDTYALDASRAITSCNVGHAACIGGTKIIAGKGLADCGSRTPSAGHPFPAHVLDIDQVAGHGRDYETESAKVAPNHLRGHPIHHARDAIETSALQGASAG